MKKHLKWLVLATSTLGLGISMPNCPGQQALQQQVESLQASNLELQKRVQALNNQIVSLNNDMNQVKQILPQMTSVIKDQKDALNKLDTTVKALQAKASPKTGFKKRGK